MREIKFRAWDATENKMIYNVDLEDGKCVKPGYQWFNKQNTVYHSVPMQYTGLKFVDDSDVDHEIWDGDIFHYTRGPQRPDDQDEGIAVVHWDDEWGAWLLGLEFLSSALQTWELTALGNVWENPEVYQSMFKGGFYGYLNLIEGADDDGFEIVLAAPNLEPIDTPQKAKVGDVVQSKRDGRIQFAVGYVGEEYAFSDHLKRVGSWMIEHGDYVIVRRGSEATKGQP